MLPNRCQAGNSTILVFLLFDVSHALKLAKPGNNGYSKNGFIRRLIKKEP
jgi:hypothetical protein